MMDFFRRLRKHTALRYLGLGVTILIAILAAAIVSSIAVDLGPVARRYAENFGSSQVQRPVRIGSLSIRLFSGRVEVRDFYVAGFHPEDRPFFTAKRLSLSLDWSTLVQRRPEIMITGVDLADWQMLVEKWPDEDSFPKLKPRPDDGSPPGERKFTTTLRYFHGSNGRFTYEDHEAPWGVDAPNIDLVIRRANEQYEGRATFSGGAVSIKSYAPMWTNMQAAFTINDGKIRLSRIDIDSDGAKTVCAGEVDVAHWPEMTYSVKSHLQFERMRQIFFADETWRLAGEGDFDGTFHLFKHGHDLAGRFASPLAGLNGYRFASLGGSLHWTRDLFEVLDAGSGFSGGATQFKFSIEPLGRDDAPAVARFETAYRDIDLAELADFQEWRGLRFGGSVTGHNVLEWPTGRFKEHSGAGDIVVTPPDGVQTMGAALPAPAGGSRSPAGEWGPFGPALLPRHLPIAGDVTYRFDKDNVYADAGTFATGHTHVSFRGVTAWAEESAIRFHVTSSDWQESQQLLAGIISDFGSPTGPVPFGGRGEFEGVLTGRMKSPRVEGLFTGEDLRAWDTLWGDGRAQIVFENDYITVKDGVITRDGSEIRAEGLFSLGYPRRDGGQEIDARVRVDRRDVDSLRHAFQIDDYAVSGRLSGEFHLTGEYQHPIGFGAMTIADGLAYGEPFEQGSASVRFDGLGIRLDGLTIAKRAGTVAGAAFVGWDGTYSFDVAGRGIPVDSVRGFSYPSFQPSGMAEFTASGNGTFDLPRYDVKFRVNDLLVASEPVGQVTGTIAVRGKELTGAVDAASPRLSVTGTGRISLTPAADSELTFRFHDSSLDPYVRLFVPKLSPYTTAVASGSIRVAGSLADVDRLLVEGTVDGLDVRVFDYAVHNAAPIRLALDNHVVRLDDLRLAGDGTELRVSGTVGLHEDRIALQVVGDANLAVLQGFFHDVRGTGRAELTAAVNGPLRSPVFSGSAILTGGRIRHFSLPNALDDIAGTLYFDGGGIRLDDVSATMAGGHVQFGGRVGFDGYTPSDLNVTMRASGMRLRYPEGVRSTVDADLNLVGNLAAPVLAGTVRVREALWNRRIDPTAGVFDFASGRGAQGDPVAGAAPSVPLRFDLQVVIPSTLRIENNLARLVASADLQLSGTYDHPIVFGHTEVDRGEVIFEGRRYRVTRGAIEFTNPSRIEPFFDVEAETRVRIPGQTYRVTVRAAGTTARLQPTLESDPPLPPADVLALLFSDIRRNQGDAELSALQNPNQAQSDILTSRATQLLAGPISSQVGRVVEQTFGVDTFQLTPTLVDPYSQSTTTRVNPSARVTIGKRISERVYLTYSRSVTSSTNDQIILLEYDQSDRLSWILSQNEDQTYAVEVRVRHTF